MLRAFADAPAIWGVHDFLSCLVAPAAAGIGGAGGAGGGAGGALAHVRAHFASAKEGYHALLEEGLDAASKHGIEGLLFRRRRRFDSAPGI